MACEINASGLDGLVDKLLVYVSPEFATILAADKPPTADQLRSLPKPSVAGRDFACYLLSAFYAATVQFYAGSATDKGKGFAGPKRAYEDRNVLVMPKFITSHIQKKHKFESSWPSPYHRFPTPDMHN